MRCPNCGNENPPDYLFCDECGARLMGGDVAAMADAPEAGAMPGMGGGGGSGSPGAAPIHEDAGGAMANYADYGMGVNQPMPTAVEQGTNTSTGYAGINNSGSDYDNTGLSAIPVTEDTMGGQASVAVEAPALPDVIKPLPSLIQASENSGAAYNPTVDNAADAGASAYADAEESFSGIPDDARMSIEEGLADMTGISGSAANIGSIPDVVYPDHEEAVPAPSGSADSESGSGNEWASNALGLLHQAQSALAGGDWGVFGEVMNNLAATLQSAAGGAGAASPSLTPPSRIEPAVSQDMGSTTADDSQYSSPAYTSSASSSSDYSSSAPASSYEAPVVVATPDSSSMSTAISEPPAPAVEPPPAPPAFIEPEPVPPTVTPMATAAPVQTPGASGARLILISTGAEMSIPDQEEITVGREDPSSGIFPDIDLTPHGGEDGGVSRRHARMLHIGDDYFVEDLQSTNFTKLDGQRLPAHVRERLEDGARLDFGRVAMIFRRG